MTVKKIKRGMPGDGLVPRMGGKKVLKKIIVDNFPIGYEDMIYIEPFVGSGSILFQKHPSKEEIINDIDKKMIIIFNGFKNYLGKDIKHSVNGYYTKEDFKKILDYEPKSDFEEFIKTFLSIRLSYFGNGKDYSTRPTLNFKRDYYDRLKDVKIMNCDYKTPINQYDSPNSFIYLDPPYENSNKTHYDNHTIDYNELKNVLSNIKGKFLCSINDSENIRDIFKEFNIKKVKTKYLNVKGGGQTKDKTELLISNYKI